MSKFAALPGSLPRRKRQHSASGPEILAAILALGLVALPADYAKDYDGGGAPANLGSLDDYMWQDSRMIEHTPHRGRTWARDGKATMARQPDLARK